MIVQDNPGTGKYNVLYNYLSTMKQYPIYSFHSKPGIGLFDKKAVDSKYWYNILYKFNLNI